MKKNLTVVIPSYNVEKFLDNTLQSFVCNDQTMKKLEVIIVDDGSKDGTASIAQKFCSEYPDTFRLISKENGGHGSTINCGMKNATGIYFKVVDGDDWVNTSELVKLVERLENCDSDYVFTNYCEYYDDIDKVEKKEYSDYFDGQVLTGFDELKNDFCIPMHALAIRTDILRDNNIVIDEKCFYVDVEYILYPVPYVKKITYFDLCVYMYRLNLSTQSVSVLGFQRHVDDHKRVTLNVMDFLNKYSNTNMAEKVKISYIKKRVIQMVIAQYNIFSSFSINNKKIKSEFIEFDNTLKVKNLEIYEYTSKLSKKLALLRKFNFRYYKLISALSKLRNM